MIETCSKPKENVINRKFNDLTLNIAFMSLVRQDFKNIFTLASQILSHSSNNYHIQRQTIEYPLFILLLFYFSTVKFNLIVSLILIFFFYKYLCMWTDHLGVSGDLLIVVSPGKQLCTEPRDNPHLAAMSHDAKRITTLNLS